MSMMSVRSDPPGLRTLPPELRIRDFNAHGDGDNRGWHRLRHNDVQVQNYGGPIYSPGGPWNGGGVRGMGDYYDESGNYIQSDTLNVDPNVATWVSSDPFPIGEPPITQDMINAELNALANAPTPTLSVQQMQAMEAASGLKIGGTAPASSNTVAPSGMEWLTVADRFNNSLLKILVASKPGTYMQQLPNGMVLYSQQPGATNLPGLVPGGGAGGSVTTPLESASFSGAMPLLIGGLVLLMFMGKR